MSMFGKWEESLQRCFVKLEWFCGESKEQKLQKPQLELFGDYIPVHFHYFSTEPENFTIYHWNANVEKNCLNNSNHVQLH